MKKIIAALALIACTATASAASMRLNNGSVLIREGTPANVLIKNAGRPSYKSSSLVCVEYRSRDCREWGRVESWFYTIEDVNWEIKVYKGRVLDLEWSKF